MIGVGEGVKTASFNLYQFFLKIKRREVLNFITQLKECFSKKLKTFQYNLYIKAKDFS